MQSSDSTFSLRLRQHNLISVFVALCVCTEAPWWSPCLSLSCLYYSGSASQSAVWRWCSPPPVCVCALWPSAPERHPDKNSKRQSAIKTTQNEGSHLHVICEKCYIYTPNQSYFKTMRWQGWSFSINTETGNAHKSSDISHLFHHVFD